MVTVWERLGEMFGGLWESSYGTAEDPAINTWTRGLFRFSETSIRAALDLMAGWPKPFPPSLGEFAEICRQYRPSIEPGRQITHNPRAPREVAERELARMKGIIKGDYPETTEEALESLGRHE